ncbi:TPA: hypothetical protein I7740_12750 [Vibrio vulnificus]|nr:hypothetical protein [Vibrio vulnificus]
MVTKIESKPFACEFVLRDQGYKIVNNGNEQNLAHCLPLIICSFDRQLIDCLRISLSDHLFV